MFTLFVFTAGHLALSASAGSGPVFARIPDAGPVVEAAVVAGAAAFADFDGDGDLDISTGFETTHIHRNDGTFTELLSGDAVTNDPTVIYGGGIWADYDNDGDLDFYRGLLGDVDAQGNLTNPRQDRLYRNEGPPDHALVHVPFPGDSTVMNSASWVDADRDGDVDVFVAGLDDTDLFLRNDGGSFVPLTNLAIINSVANPFGTHDTWLDIDLDGDEDLYVANIGVDNELYMNRFVETGSLAFEEIVGGPLTSEGFVFDVAGVFGDYDNDGDPDMFLPTTSGPPDQLYRNEGGGAFVRILTGDPVEAGNRSATGTWGDADNDGDLDLFVPQVALGALASFFYRNDGGGVLSRVTSDLGDLLDPIPGVSAAQWGDVDDDGDLDVFVATLRSPNNPTGTPAANVLFRNEGAPGHWLGIRCTGTLSNRSAIGARIEVTATIGGESVTQSRFVSGSGVSALFQAPLRQHVGLGDATSATMVRVIWPSGIVQTVTDVAADQTIDLVEPESVGVGPAGATAPAVVTLRHAPNPAAHGTWIHVATRDADAATIDIYDASGRHVRSLEAPGGAPGDRRVRWDGTDGDGQRVAPGAYLYRLRGGGGDGRSPGGRIVVVR